MDNQSYFLLFCIEILLGDKERRSWAILVHPLIKLARYCRCQYEQNYLFTAIYVVLLIPVQLLNAYSRSLDSDMLPTYHLMMASFDPLHLLQLIEEDLEQLTPLLLSGYRHHRSLPEYSD